MGLKMDMNMNVSDKEKQLIVYIVAALIVLGSWYFGFRNFNAQTAKYKAESKQLQAKVDDLTEKTENKSQYIASTAAYNDEAAKIISTFATGHSLPNTIKYIYEMEHYLDELSEDSALFVSNFSIADGTVVYSFSDGAKQGVSVPVTFTYESNYDTTKKVIDYINSFETKCTIDSMTIAYDTENDISSGTVEMQLYSVITPESTRPEVDIEMPIGNDNIFMATSAYFSDMAAETGDYIVEDHDVYVEIAQPAAELDSVKIGLKSGEDAPIAAKVNDKVAAQIVFGGTEASGYTVAYKIGDVTYPAANFYKDGVKFTPGDSIDVFILSTDLAATNDKLKVDMEIVNDSDKLINVKLVGDDDAKRVNITKAGRVKVY